MCTYYSHIFNRVSRVIAPSTDSISSGAMHGPHKQQHQHQSSGSMHHDGSDTAGTLASQAAEAAKKAAQVCCSYTYTPVMLDFMYNTQELQ
jgi:hypothetical protein